MPWRYSKERLSLKEDLKDKENNSNSNNQLFQLKKEEQK